MAKQYSQLFIDFTASYETYQKVTDVLGVTPQPHDSNEIPDLWFYRLERCSEDRQEDFINHFLDLLEPNFEELERLGINRKNILFWYVYEYEYQCSMSFTPSELLRLGESGITMNIDCHDFTHRKSL